jgi:hypothetical protein
MLANPGMRAGTQFPRDTHAINRHAGIVLTSAKLRDSLAGFVNANELWNALTQCRASLPKHIRGGRRPR